jgi:hypothetical protein
MTKETKLVDLRDNFYTYNKYRKTLSEGDNLIVSKEIAKRIKLAVAAYAYEYGDNPVMSDGEFDKLAMEVDLSIKTGNNIMDDFFKTNFDAFTGAWVRSHPDIVGLKRIYNMKIGV